MFIDFVDSLYRKYYECFLKFLSIFFYRKILLSFVCVFVLYSNFSKDVSVFS